MTILVRVLSQDVLVNVISRGFNLVKSHWKSAWGKKPSESRLMHGAGLRAMAGLLVHLLERDFAAHGDFHDSQSGEGHHRHHHGDET